MVEIARTQRRCDTHQRDTQRRCAGTSGKLACAEEENRNTKDEHNSRAAYWTLTSRDERAVATVLPYLRIVELYLWFSAASQNARCAAAAPIRRRAVMLSRLSSLAARPASRVALGVAASAACGTAAAATCDNSVIHLKYFDARGVVETSRILLARHRPP